MSQTTPQAGVRSTSTNPLRADRAYRALAEPTRHEGTTVLRRRLIRLSAQIWWHPYWSTPASGPGDRVALRGRARELESGRL
ncbi:hypothetical protein ACFRK5_22785 [Streptomyces niveus]|uniref:hypothetical protein n=1 Tax=Streptomyces niveus TaxID=193462 RepID=UPI003686C2D7